jgi:hypothetical protein
MRLGSSLHREKERALESIEAYTGILDVIDEHIDVAEHLRRRFRDAAVQGIDPNACTAVDRIEDRAPVRRISADAVLGTEQDGKRQAMVGSESVCEMAPVREESGMIRDEADAFADEQVHARGEEDVGAGADLGKSRRAEEDEAEDEMMRA